MAPGRGSRDPKEGIKTEGLYLLCEGKGKVTCLMQRRAR